MRHSDYKVQDVRCYTSWPIKLYVQHLWYYERCWMTSSSPAAMNQIQLNIVPQKRSLGLGHLLLGNRHCCVQKKRVPKFAYYSYSVNFSQYYSAEYKYTIRPTIRAEQNTNRIFGTGLPCTECLCSGAAQTRWGTHSTPQTPNWIQGWGHRGNGRGQGHPHFCKQIAAADDIIVLYNKRRTPNTSYIIAIKCNKVVVIYKTTSRLPRVKAKQTPGYNNARMPVMAADDSHTTQKSITTCNCW